MTRRRSYYEATIPFHGDALTTITETIRSAVSDDYVLYEYNDEWSMGTGVHARVTVYPEKTVVEAGGERREHPNGREISPTLDAALAELPVAGWRGYGTATFELSRFNYGLDVPPDEPLLKLFVPEAEVRVRKGSILVRALERDVLDAFRDAAEAAAGSAPPPPATPLDLSEEIATINAEAYKDSVRAALKEIHAHDYRKVIMSRRVPLPHALDMVASYATGRRGNSPARSYLLRFDGLEAAGFSPETVAEITASGDVFTTPLAGTRSTGEDLMEELELREELLSDTKEIAEHAISVYLAFDELTMACDPTSVRVINFMLVSHRGAVQHLASRLQGRLLERCNPWHAFNALFPAVTASGVPKFQSIDAIGRLEPRPRGLYAGCVMICDEGAAIDAALVLRSFYRQDGQVWLQAGAGIMNLSNPERELEETREKLSSVALHLVGSS